MQGRKTRKRIFLGSEGLSERNYGQYLRLIANNHSLPIHIDCNYVTGGGDPLKIVEESSKLMKRNSRNHGDYLVKAIILDSDKLGRSIDRDNKIRQLISGSDIRLLYSSPNFEAWFDGTFLRSFLHYQSSSLSHSSRPVSIPSMMDPRIPGIETR